MIPAGCTELRKAFFNHHRVSNTGDEDSHRLLLFYGLECGLKAVYLRRNGINKTNQISNNELQSSHDLFLFIKELKLPAQTVGASPPSFRLRRDGTALPIEKAHEVWRYGIVIKEDDAQKLDKWMHDIHAWVKENI